MERSVDCTEGALYTILPHAVSSTGLQLHLGMQIKGKQRKGIVKSFLKRHLPVNRLLANEDDLIHSYLTLGNQSRRSKFSFAKKKQKRLTKKERKGMHLFEISEEQQRFAHFEQHLPMHLLWKEYMQELTASSSLSTPEIVQAVCQRVVKADLHGCLLTVQRSKCPSYVGLSGIVLKETRNVFALVTREGAVKYVPKMNTTFIFPVSDHVFTIHGNHFRVKAGERSSKKFKSKATVDL